MKRRIIFFMIITIFIYFLTGCINSTVDKSTIINSQESVGNEDISNEESHNSENSTVLDEGNKAEENKKEDKNEVLLKEILDKAKDGEVIDCKFKAKYNIIDDVNKEWGKEEKFDYIADAKGNYFTFKDKDEVFGVNKGGVIFEVRTFSPKLKELTLKDIISYFGEQEYDIISKLEERIIGYVINDEFKIILVFKDGYNDNPILDHYSILYPKETINMMADDPGREW